MTVSTLHYDDETGAYTFIVTPRHGSEFKTIVASKTANVIETASSPTLVHSEIVLTAYPDHIPSAFDLAPNHSHFLILTATSHTSERVRSGLGIDFQDQAYDSDNEPELPMSYSGTGILIIPTTDYRHHHNGFAAEISRLETKIAELKENWKIENTEKELEGLKTWIGDLTNERHWRRTGVVEFKDWS
ncbi:hypothetical protein SLS60_000383 [Paraconiothyrium brasiliense]|uniref:Uncharacterized protein n=1 Tax=Paraconiothyrium brasiliense TaxID=300254 RepID=A0ABR3S630_9PLEO